MLVLDESIADDSSLGETSLIVASSGTFVGDNDQGSLGARRSLRLAGCEKINASLWRGLVAQAVERVVLLFDNRCRQEFLNVSFTGRRLNVSFIRFL